MNPTDKRWAIHKANKKRTSESDIPAKFKVMKIIKENFGLYALTDQTILIPDGYATHRSPDLMISYTTPVFLIELMGGIHNLDEENPSRTKDIQKREDYARLSKGYHVIELYEKDDFYAEERVIKELYERGLPMNKDEAQKYRNRKVTRYA